MRRRHLEKIRAEIEGMRHRLGSLRARELIAVAKEVGRAEMNRGKEPTYEHPDPESRPLTIPKHGRGKCLKKGTASRILDVLDADLDRLEPIIADDDEEQN